MKSPTVSTLKALFALSGNRCAFPKCMNRLVEESSGTLVGKVCHIKGKSSGPGSKRYDKYQTDEERHGVGNLIALCPQHHDVIDDDEEAYTVERLVKMKADHVEKMRGEPTPSDALAERFAVSIYNNTVTDGSIIHVQGQSGGQVAHTINYYNHPVEHGPSRLEAELAALGLAAPSHPDFGRTKYSKRMALADSRNKVVPIRTTGIFFSLTPPPLVRDEDRPRFFQWMDCNKRRYEPIDDSFFLPSPVPDVKSKAHVWHDGHMQRVWPVAQNYFTYLAVELDEGYMEYGFCPGSPLEPDGDKIYYAKIVGGFVAFLRYLRDFAEQFGADPSTFSVGLALRGTGGTSLKCITKRILEHFLATSHPEMDGFRWVREATPGTDWTVDAVARRAALDVLEHWSYSGPAGAGEPEFKDGKYTGEYYRSDFQRQW
jgi:hypothetical protein